MKKETLIKRFIRKRRVRSKISGTAEKPRISVFRSSKYVEVQLINDSIGKTIVRVSTKDIKGTQGKTELAQKAGELLAQKAKEAGINNAVFDRRHYKYHGRVKAVAEGARAGGLKL
jgi:large subunit ribosomal protein L18